MSDKTPAGGRLGSGTFLTFDCNAAFVQVEVAMSDFNPDSMAADLFAGELARDEALLSALRKLWSCVNEVYVNREQFADDLHIQKVISNAHQQAARACGIAQTVIADRSTSGRVISSRDTREDNVVAFPLERSHPPLTRREFEALALLRDGYTNKRAALEMGISPRTFECYRAELKRKLGARNTAELVLRALQLRNEP